MHGSVGYFGKPQDSYFKVWLNNGKDFLKLILLRSQLNVACLMPSVKLLQKKPNQEDIDLRRPCTDFFFFLKAFLSGKFPQVFQTRFRRIIKALNRHQLCSKFLTSLIIDMLPAVIRHAIYIRCFISRGKF